MPWGREPRDAPITDVRQIADRMSEALAALDSPDNPRRVSTSDAVCLVNAWAAARRRQAQPVSIEELDAIIRRINAADTGWRSSAVVRVDERLHLASRLRFH